MFHKAIDLKFKEGTKLEVKFQDGLVKRYDMKVLFSKYPVFEALKDRELFEKGRLMGYGIIWNDVLDLSCDELYENGKTIETPFDNLIAFSDATQLWGLNESTLRKAITYGKIVPGVDACKYGKQWVISKKAMYREYGDPDDICCKA